MPRKIAVLLAIFIPFLASANPGGHPVPVWLVEGESNSIYLLGSVHMLRKSDHPLPSAIESAYVDADSLLMEIDMDDLDPVASQALVTQLGILNDGRSLRELMGPERYAKAAAAALAMDIPIEMLDKTEPWLAAITVEQLALNRIGFNPIYGVELHLMAKAVADGKEIAGFESIEEQIRFLDGLSLDAQIELLLQTLDESIDISSEMDRMIDAWRHGDVQYLEENMLSDMQQYPELYRRLVVDRNQRWVDTIQAMLDDDENYLIIVGALHLIGDDGVPDLLSRLGVNVSQMHQPAN
jgi:uncharacterized protein YbaP (TraB family)